MYGKGKYTFPSGNVYEGDYVDSKRNGKGVFRWPNGGWFYRPPFGLFYLLDIISSGLLL